jgi:hypothetical protein
MQPSNTQHPALRSGAVATLLVTCAALGLSAPASAASNPESRLFDRPAEVRTLAPKSADDPVGQITCTYYAGLMVREIGTDTPDPGAATMVAFLNSAHRPTCGRSASPTAIAMKTEGFSLLGRKGPFLVFDATDPNGAVDFVVLAASTGATLFEDGKSDRGLRSVALVRGVLRLTYRRGLNAPCSVLKDRVSCWASLAHAGAIPATLGRAPPPVRACAAAYRKGPRPAPADDPSIILYAVTTTVDGSGKAHVTVSGRVTCAPMP